MIQEVYIYSIVQSLYYSNYDCCYVFVGIKMSPASILPIIINQNQLQNNIEFYIRIVVILVSQ